MLFIKKAFLIGNLTNVLNVEHVKINVGKESEGLMNIVKPTFRYWIFGWIGLVEDLLRILSFGAIATYWTFDYLVWLNVRDCKKEIKSGNTTRGR